MIFPQSLCDAFLRGFFRLKLFAHKLAGYPAILLSVFLAHVFVEHCHEQIRL